MPHILRFIPILILTLALAIACGSETEPTLAPTASPTEIGQDTATPAPTSASTIEISPSPTTLPAASPTFELIATFNISPERILTMDMTKEDGKGEQWWQDKKPLVLVGCRAQATATPERGIVWMLFTSDGKVHKTNFKASVGGKFKPIPAPGQCFEVVARYDGINSYCFNSSFGSASIGCAGNDAWREGVPKFRVLNENAIKRIAK